MASPTYLMKRNGIYYARIPVPKQLQEQLGRKELWKSLGNRSYKESCKLLREALLSETLLMPHAKQETELLRSKSAMVAIGQRQHELERQRLCRQFLDLLQQQSRLQMDESQRDTQIEFHKWVLSEEIAEYRKDIQSANFKPYEKRLSTRLNTTRFHPPERSTRAYGEAMTQLLRGLISGAEDAQKAIESGDYIRFINDEIAPYPEWMLPPQIKSKASEKQKAGGSDKHTITLGDLIARFNGSAEIQKRSAAVRIKDLTYQALLRQALGEDTDISKITRPTVRASLLPVLDLLPANYQKKPEYKGMNALQTVEREKSKPSEHAKLSPASKNDYLEHLSYIMRWAKAEGFDVVNPIEGLLYKDDVKAKEKRDPLSVEAINAFLADPIVLKAKDAIPVAHMFWVPFISLTTGMRISEIVLLAISDIKVEKKIPYFNLEEREGRTLKTEASVRKVPIPLTLHQAGFERYVAKIKADPKANNRLFPYLSIGTRRPGDPFSKWFSRRLEALGIKNDKISFHSLRHSFRDFITEAVLPPEERQIALSMTGWEANEVHARYGAKDYPLGTAQTVINKIKLGGVKLSHLGGKDD